MTWPALLMLMLMSACTGERSGQRAVSAQDFARPVADGPAAKEAAAERMPTRAPSPEAPATSAVDAAAANGAASNGSSGSDTEASIERQTAQVLGNLPRPVVTLAAPLDGARALTVDAMVGQVNGQPIYASRVLSAYEPQFERWGRELSPQAFRREAANVISLALGEIVFNRLILGEADRDLSERERMGLEYMLREQREKLIRKWGAGSLMTADVSLRQATGKGLDEELQDFRQRRLIDRYLAQKLIPKINVSRKDIERYYYDNIQQFHPQPGRTIRLIRADDAAAAREVEKLLAEGTDFVSVASSRFNSYRREQGGLFGQKVSGDEIFGIAPLNEAVLALKAGEHSPRIAVGPASYWVFVEEMETGRQRPLREVQRDIEDLLRRQRFQKLTSRYREQLFAAGTYNPLDEMAKMLVEIAVSRHYRLASN